ncbi:LOW QUALITY PROTEIN: hypothetical protein KUTeg_019756 [Tegillarca granosa]|uniref:Uncharacterized protein n=1 Tax=Tegillarca granosa TaxID=220873 RepID=A0ABQ9EIY2_TEGGR|nr:LOW QUALITY PROTEIN: hypothetical protein KUTeg_019756 [Tegillarca granosa]
MLTVVPPPDPRYYNNPAYPDYNPRSRTIKGPVAFDFSMDEISQRIRNEIGFYNTLENFEMIFNVSVRDWFLDMQETGFASTIIVSSKYKLQWVGDKVRTFKPDSVLTVQVAAMTYDGRPVTSLTTKINMQVYPSYGTGGSGTPIYIQPKTPVNGIAQFQIPIDTHLKSLKLAATLNDDTRTRIEMMTYRFYSPSNNYIILSTSTPSPKINEYMIFHVKLSNFVPRIYYQIKEPKKGKYRLNYNAEDITKALVMVNEKGVSVERAARSCGVPVTTLKDRVRGRVGIDVIKSGPDPLFSLEEESQLFDHISTMAEIGYGYTRAETLNLASDYSVHLGHRERQHPLSLCWLYNFLQRWPDVRIQKPHSLEAVRAKCTSKEIVNRYFEELEKILNKYGLKDKPERVFNIDEKGLSTDCKPPNIIAATSYKPQVVTTGKTKTVTVIGTGNAIGNQVPPYFIFPGQRMVSKLLKRASVGVQGTVSETGWSNTDIFEMYLKEHLIKNLPARDTNNKVVVLYDGHKSHVAMGIIDWARKENIVLFVLPPHTSHILQPLDVSVFGPFEVAWHSACYSHLRDTGGNIITRYDVCKIACSVYTKTLTPSNIQSAFKKSGIYPFDPSIIPDTALAPALSFPVEVVPTAENVVAGGNIIVGEELEMISRRKTFAIALSKEMVPTARVVVYYISTSPEEIVMAKVNLGKDFTRDTVEIITTADPGSYMAFAAMPDDLYRRGINDGLTEYNLIDELNTYDQPARGSWQHLWRKSETEFEYKFFTATGHGIDTNTTFRDAGLLAISDVTVNRVPTEPSCNLQGAEYQPCFDGVTCYHKNKTCDGIFDCPNDWADEQNCPVEDPRYDNRTMGSYMINRVSRVLRFYEDSAWAWKEIFTKPDGEVDFRVKVPKYPLTWVINGISMSRNLGLGLMAAPLKIGVRVTVFNYWAKDDFIEVLVTMEGSTEYDSVLVGEEGFVTSYNPITHSGDHQTLVFLEPGESKDIFMPIVPKAVRGQFNFTVSAWCFLERDTVTKTVFIDSDGVENYFHTPYLYDYIWIYNYPDLKINVSDQFIVPEQRFHSYVPGSPKATVSMFGDVVTPGFFREYLTVEDLMYKPYGAGEMNMFNFAYNLLTLKFKKANQQLSNDVLKKALSYMNIGLQRQLSYMNKDGSFRMFRDDDKLTAFVAKTLYDARFGEWEKDMFIPLELINTMVLWICDQQNSTTGEFNENITTPLYDRTYGSLKDMKNRVLISHPVPLTAYVLIALYKISDVSGPAQSCIEKARNRAASYLYNRRGEIIQNNETFHLAITAYALSLSTQESQSIFNSLWELRRESTGIYFSDSEIRENPSDFINTVRYLLPRLELINDGYATQSTAYALMAHIKHYGSQTGGRKAERDSMMGWLQTMRNFIGAMASTQDTLVAMEALFDFTQVDPNRNVFNLYTLLECSSQPDWSDVMFSTKENYTKTQFAEIDKVYGQVRVTAQVRSKTSGLSVLEVEVPSGYVVLNDTLRSYVQSGVVRNLKRAEFYYRKVVFYFDYLDQSKTCVYFQANRWYPVANMTIQHRIRVYDYYEPGMHNTGLYTTYNLFNLNVCYVCGSYQCPYCPFFNVATVIKASFTLITLLVGFLLKRYLLRIT